MMNNLLQWMKEHQGLVWSVSGASVAILVASFFIIPAVIVRLRADYFAHDKRPERWKKHPKWIRIALLVGKNVLGVVLIICGLAMIALPGPGLVTAFIGLLMVNFPGKYRFERWLMSRPAIFNTINKMRRRAGRKPLVVR